MKARLGMRKVLVTGGTGFIGQHLVARLLAEDCFVYLLTRRAERYADNGRIAYIAGDFTRPQPFASILSQVDAVYHLAVTTIPGSANEKVIYDAQTNLLGSLALIEQAAQAGVRRFIFTSSGGSVYGPNGGAPLAEDHPTDPISAHGVSKLAIEKYLEIYRRLYGMEYRVARAANPYGIGQDPNRGQGFIAYALGQMAQNQPLVVWGDGSVVRDYVYVEDTVEALRLLLDDDGPYTIYNVGSGLGYAINEMIAILQEVTGQAAAVRYVEGRAADVPYNCLDIGRIQQNLNWQPTTSLSQGIEWTWAWICETVYRQTVMQET
jgi:UDP-glucose 4-epimerase